MADVEARRIGPSSACQTRRVELDGGDRTWTVVGPDHLPVAPVEQWLEYLRTARAASPNTVRSYARGLALWWSFLLEHQLPWDKPDVGRVGTFVTWLRTGDSPAARSTLRVKQPPSEDTISVRVKAVQSFYAFHLPGSTWWQDQRPFTRPRWSAYKPMLAHLARPLPRSAIGLRQRRRVVPPTFTPAQIDRILQASAIWDPTTRRWAGSLRNRLLWALLAGTGMRLGEALAVRHCDWRTSRGDLAWVEIEPRTDHPHQMRVKNSSGRRVLVSDELDRLYGDYVVELCERGAADLPGSFDDSYLFVNLERGPLFRAMRPETVYDEVARLHRLLSDTVHSDWTPHWFRHTHATALLLSGVDPVIVARRLGHADVQTTLTIYAHVNEDAQLRALDGWARWAGPGATGKD